MDYSSIADSLLMLPAPVAAARLRALARLAPGAAARLAAWAHLPDDALASGLRREASALPALAPLAARAGADPAWLREVARALRSGVG